MSTNLINGSTPKRRDSVDTTPETVHGHQLLPASYHITSSRPANQNHGQKQDAYETIAAPHVNVQRFLDHELSLGRLATMHDRLWFAAASSSGSSGSSPSPRPPRPLHHLRGVAGRALVITERLDMHLVRSGRRIFIKPLPEFLFNQAFLIEHLHCSAHSPCGCANRAPSPAEDGEDDAVCRRDLRRRALGFMFSYAALVSYPSDYYIAQELHLLPPSITWTTWRKFVENVLEHGEDIYERIDPRFVYGELNLSRLNLVAFSQHPFSRWSTKEWDGYRSFWSVNIYRIALLILALSLLLIITRVGLKTKEAADSTSFQGTLLGFTVLSIFIPFEWLSSWPWGLPMNMS